MMKRSSRFSSSLTVLALALSACGGGGAPGLADPTVFNRAPPAPPTETTAVGVVKSAARSTTATRAARTPTPVELFNRAEQAYPTLAPTTPTRPPDQTFQTYVYRFYTQTDIILGVNTADNTVLGLVDVTKPSARIVQLGRLADYACFVFPGDCGPAPVTFDAASVSSGSTEVASFLTACQTTRSGAVAPAPAPGGEPTLAERLKDLQQAVAVTRSGNATRGATYTGTQPADKLGSCGGRMSYTSYSHSSGTTTATRTFTNYCTTGTEGKQQVINGTMSFVNTATPTASGPITTRFVAQSPGGLAMVTKSGTGSTLSSQVYKFTNYSFTPGVPGGSPTASSPDRIQADEIVSTNAVTGKSYRQTGYSVTMFDTASGGQQASVSGRGYRSNGEYYDLSTTQPIVTNADGDYVSGVFTFRGAGSSTTVATVVPGSKLQTTLEVDGAPVTNLPACGP